MKNLHNRNLYIDIIKGLSIILVVFGHCIQYGNGKYFLDNGLYWNDSTMKIIYSFHMPLFMLISGYLFHKTLNKHQIKDIINNKLISLTPMIPFGILWFCCIKYIEKIKVDSTIGNIKLLIKCIVTNFWFIWAIFFCSIIVIIVRKKFKDNIFIYLFIFLLLFFVPTYLNSHLYCYMYPYFIIGYFSNKYNVEILLKKTNLKLIITLFILFITILQFYNYDSYIYTSHYFIFGSSNILKQLIIDIYRFIIGIIGSTLIITIIWGNKFIINSKELAYLGKNSLGIYIFSTFIFMYLLPYITMNVNGINYYVNLIETIVIIIICLILEFFAKKNKITSIILLGVKRRD